MSHSAQPISVWDSRTALAARWFYVLAAVPLLGLLFVPIFVLTGRFSFEMLREQLSNRATLDALRLSIITGGITTCLAVFMGTPLAYVIAMRRSRFAKVLDVMIELPIVFPPLIAGIALLLIFSRNGILGRHLESMGIELVFTPAAVVIAQLFVAAPFYIKTASIGMGALAGELEEAAMLDGADWLQYLRYIAIPIAFPAVFCGAALCFSRALGEFGATIMFAGNMPGRTQTITLAVYLGFESDVDQAITLSLILLCTSLTILIITRTVVARVRSDR